MPEVKTEKYTMSGGRVKFEKRFYMPGEIIELTAADKKLIEKIPHITLTKVKEKEAANV